jgi:hypothetical protein
MAQPIDRIAIQILGDGVLAHQCPASRLDAEWKVSTAGLRRLRQSLERIACEFWIFIVCSRLDELGQGPRRDPRVERVRGGCSAAEAASL